MNGKKNDSPSASSAALVLLLAAMATASEPRRGFYFGTDTGASMAPGIESTRSNVGIPTNCDQWLEEFTFDDGDTVPLPLEDCIPRALPGSPNPFDLGGGLLAGAKVGYAVHNFRVEAEFLHREQSGDHLPLIVPGDEKQLEFVERSEKISDFRTNGFFANLHYDFNGMSDKLVPHLGVGLGFMRTTMDYSATSIRTNDREELIGLGRNPAAAGTASLANEVLSDNLPGYQLTAGLTYAFGERFFAGIKLRYGGALGDFEDGDNPWKPLRGHASTVGPPGEPGGDLPVRYGITVGGLNFWGVSVVLNHYL